MYTKFSANNFRGFKKFTIDSLDRVNLIAGKNNTGKTALLEAMFIHHGSPNPSLGFKVNNFRGIQEINVNEPLIELFRNLSFQNKIEFKSTNTKKQTRSDKIYLNEGSRIALHGDKPFSLEGQLTLSADMSGKEVVIEYTDESGKNGKATATFSEGNVIFDPPVRQKRPIGRFLTSRRNVSQDEVEGFGAIEIKGMKDEIVNMLQVIEPRLIDLTVVVRGGKPTIWGNVGIDTLLPLQVMGEGLGRWLVLVEAILRCPDGIVLIDEIENGFHYSIMSSVWRSIALLARKHNVQICATTHSAECIQSAHQAFSESSQYDFRLHRLESYKGVVSSITYDQEMLATAIDTGLEFR